MYIVHIGISVSAQEYVQHRSVFTDDLLSDLFTMLRSPLFSFTVFSIRRAKQHNKNIHLSKWSSIFLNLHWNK